MRGAAGRAIMRGSGHASRSSSCCNMKNTTLIEDLQNHDPGAVFAVIIIIMMILLVIAILSFIIYMFSKYHCKRQNRNRIEISRVQNV